MNVTVIERFELDIILGFSHDAHALVFPHVARESGLIVFKRSNKFVFTVRAQAARGCIFTDVTTYIGIQGVDAKSAETVWSLCWRNFCFVYVNTQNSPAVPASETNMFWWGMSAENHY